MNPVVPNITPTKTRVLHTETKTQSTTHMLPRTWVLFHKNTLNTKDFSWAEMNIENALINEEHIYKCLLLQACNVLLKPKPTTRFTLPTMWKVLKDKGYVDRISGWLESTYDVHTYLTTIDQYDSFINIIIDDLIEYRKYLETHTIQSWKHSWLHLIQHFL